MLVRVTLLTALLLSLHAEAAAAEHTGAGADDLFPSPKGTDGAQPAGRGPAQLVLPKANAPLTPDSQTRTRSPPKPAQPATQGQRRKVDESGLRYFASQNQQKRVEKEIQRLKALYPEWSPPDDLYLGPPGGPDEQPFWDLFADNKLEEVRTRIAERMRGEPNWRPSAALIYKIERKESRNKLVAAYDAKDWQRVIDVAAADPKIMVCADIDVPWRVAEAFAEAGQKRQTYDVYRFILTNCRDRDFRMTTMKKALAYFEPNEIDVLVAMGSRNEDGTHEFDEIRIDALRVRLGKLAQGKADEKVQPGDLKFFEDQTRSGTRSADASMLGWYRYSRNDLDQAAAWFKSALDWPEQKRDDGQPMEQQAKMAEGYILTLKGQGKFDEAEQLAFQWRDRSETIRALFIDIFGDALLRSPPATTFAADRIARYEMLAASTQSAFGTQALGWYHFNRANQSEAIRWFEASVEWSEAGKVDQKTVEGLALAYRAGGRSDDAEETSFQWRDRSPVLRVLYLDTFAESLVRQSAPIPFSDARIDRYAAMVTSDGSALGAQGLAWYHHDRALWNGAVRWFKSAIDWTPQGASDPKLAEGYAQSLRGAGRYEDAEDVAYDWRDRSLTMRSLYIDIVAENLGRMDAAATYPNLRMNRFAQVVQTERSSRGAAAVAWHLYERKTFVEASRWFRAALEYGPAEADVQKLAEGFVLAVRYQGNLAEAESLAYEWRDRSPALRRLYVEIVAEAIATLKPPVEIPAERLARFVELATETKSTFAAQAIGWFHHMRGEFDVAARWFNQSLDWGGDTADPRAAQGYLMALISLGRLEEADRLAFTWHTRSDDFRTLYIDVFGGAILRTAVPQMFPEAMLARFSYITAGAQSVFGSQAVAWYYYDRQNWSEAARWFQASLDWAGEGKHDPKTVEGFAQSLRYIGRREEAEDILYLWRDRVPLLRKLYIEIVSEGLVTTSAPIFFSDERLNRYAAVILEDRDFFGSQGLAWYRHDRRQWPDAVRWFKYAREWSPDGKGDAKMAEGLAFSLRNLELYDESEFVSVEWKDRSEQMRKLYSETVGEFLVRMKPGVTYPNDRMERYLDTVVADRNNIGAQSAGWYYFARDMYEPAAHWFLASLQWGPDWVRDPKTAEGYVTSLRLGGQLMDAEAAAYSLRDMSEQMRKLYFDIAGEVIAALKPPASYPADRLARFIELTVEAKSPAGANAIAWYHQTRESWHEAGLWFEKAIEWTGETEDEKLAEGYMLALVGLGRFEDAETLVARWRGKSDRIAGLYVEAMGNAILRLPSTASLPEDRITRYGLQVGLDRTSFGAQALAWYHYERQNWDQAARWFRANLDWTGRDQIDPKIIEGYSQSLRYAARREEAEELLYLWRGVNPTLHRLYVETFAEALVSQSAPVAFSDERIDRYADVILAERNSFGAQALAWYRYNRRVWPDAARWFRHARTWSQDGKGDAKMAEGLAFALRNMDLYDESEAVSWEWRDRSPPVRTLYIETVAEYIVRLLAKETYPVDRLSRYLTIVKADKSSIGAQAAGWYYFARDRYGEAAPWFRNALDWGPDPVRDPKTAEGLAISLRNSGQFDDAEAFAYLWRDRSERLRDMYFEFASQVMSRLRPPQAYSPERMQRFIALTNAQKNPFGAQAIGWYRAERREWAEALKWFRQALDWTGDDKDPKTIEGYALALRNSGRIDEAETLAFMWKDRSEAMAEMYIQIAVEIIGKLKPGEMYSSERYARLAQLVTERQSAIGATTIAWNALGRKDYAESEKWFRIALDWMGDTKDPKVFEGYVTALKSQNKLDEAEQLAYDWRGRNDAMRDLYRMVMMERLVATKPPATMPRERLDTFIEFARSNRSADAALGIAWYHYDRKDFTTALEWFRLSNEWDANAKDPKGAEGYALALRNLGKAEEAEAYAWEWRDRSDAMRGLYIDLIPELLGKLGPTGTFPADRLNRYQTLVSAAKSAYGAQAIAWYRYERKDYPQAAAWFKSSLDWSGDAKDAKTAEGYALALRASERHDDAEAMAFDWRDRSDAMRGLYIETFAEALTRSNPPPAFAPERLMRYVRVVSADKNAIGAQALGWYSLNIKQLRPARAWFEKALQWSPQEGSAYGLALSARAMNDRPGYDQAINTWRTRFPKIIDLLQPQAATPAGDIYATTVQPNPVERIVPVTRPARTGSTPRAAAPAQPAPAARSGSAGNSAGCIANVEAKERAGTASGADLVSKGWCLLNANRPQEAAIAFERGRNGAGQRGPEAVYGQALSELRSGETDRAAMTAEQAPMSQERRNDIGLQVLGQRIVASYRASRYMETLRLLDQRGAFGTETRDLAMLRGWSLYHIGRKDAAKRIFGELDRQLSTNETQNALAVVNNSIIERPI